MIPSTIEECMQEFKNILSPQAQMEFLKIPKDKLFEYHHSLGLWIRNNWGLWAGSELYKHMHDLGFKHPDDMSQAIITEYWNRLNGQPSDLEEDAIKSEDWWKRDE